MRVAVVLSFQGVWLTRLRTLVRANMDSSDEEKLTEEELIGQIRCVSSLSLLLDVSHDTDLEL